MSWLLGNPDTSFWSDLTALPENATGKLSASQKADLLASGKAEIQSVVDNTYDHYKNLTDEQRRAIQDYADAQKRALEKDQAALTKPECEDINLSGIGLGCASLSDLAMYALFAVGGLVALYLLVLFAPLGRRA